MKLMEKTPVTVLMGIFVVRLYILKNESEM